MDFRPEHYEESALERALQAGAAFTRKEYGVAIWIAGVAVECMLRAYRTRIDAEFDSRHNLPELLKQSGLLSAIDSDARAKGRSEQEIDGALRLFWADLNSVGRRWHNNYRYASNNRLKAHLKTAGLSQGIKGDFLKENAGSWSRPREGSLTWENAYGPAPEKVDGEFASSIPTPR